MRMSQKTKRHPHLNKSGNMKRKILFFVLLSCNLASFAYDFSAVAPSGQTLYYDIVNNAAKVTRQQPMNNPIGDLTIPASVSYLGTTYAVYSIGTEAFDGCTGLTTPNTYW